MDVPTLVAQHGGSCRWSDLKPAITRGALARAVTEGSVKRVARGRYVLSSVSEARASAVAVAGIASHTTAALHWGWGVKHERRSPT